MIQVQVNISPELQTAIAQLTAAITLNSPNNLIGSIDQLTAAVKAHTVALQANTAAVGGETKALSSLTTVEQEIAEELKPTAQSATLHLVAAGGKGIPFMPVTIQLGGPGASAAPAPAGSAPGIGFEEWDQPNGAGNELAPIGPMSYVSASPNIATVDGSGNIVAVAAGSSEITATDTGNGETASDVVTVVDVAQSATLNLVANAASKQVATKAQIAAAATKAAVPKK